VHEARRWLASVGLALRFAMAWALIDAGAANAAAEFKVAAAPPWVVRLPLDLDARPTQGQATNGVHYLLVDQQVQLGKAGAATFRRTATRALNERGVDATAHIGIEFDPSYQKLTLHEVKLHRDGRVQDRLATAHIRVLQRETELEYRVYDGSKSVDIVLDDVRSGDVVEYAYTVSGSNPVFGGTEFGRMGMQWHAPVRDLHRRLRVPSGQEIRFANHLSTVTPEVVQKAHWTQYTWRAADVPPIARQDDMPGWYDPYGAVQWSQFSDWSAVVRWAQPLYDPPRVLSAALRTEVARIEASASSESARLREVLAFVQSQIRYLGVEMGAGSHAPRAPAIVLARRYGDCKDKALLTITMLRALGIEAHAALVSTRLRQMSASQLPAPSAFNHVIVVAQADGHPYWLDPTRLPQKGSLERVVQADFGQALVLDGRSSGLAAMPLAAAELERRKIDIRIDASGQADGGASMQVRSSYEGASADRMRNTLRNESLDDLQRNYLNFYLRSYPGLAVEEKFSFEDDETDNRVITVEHYRFPSLWARDPSNGRSVAYLRVPDMKSVLQRPDDTVRSAPLTWRHPDDLTVDLTVLLPQERSIEPSRQSIHGKVFEFDARTAYAAKTLMLSYRYKSLADHVMPSDLNAHVAHLDQARALVGYTLHRGDVPRASTPGMTWLSVLGAAGLLAALAFVTWGMYLVALAEESGAPTIQPLATVLGAGHALIHAPAVVGVSLVALVGGLAGRIDMFGGTWLLLAVLLWAMWNAYWRERWLAWALDRVADKDVFRQRALRQLLLHRFDHVSQPKPTDVAD